MFEVEKKALIGASEKQLQLVDIFPVLKSNKTTFEKQLNHYFNCHGELYRVIQKFNLDIKAAEIENVIKKGYSLRTRSINGGKAILIIKIKANNTSAENGTSRREVELQTDMSIDCLDQYLLSEGFSFKSKWSRERQQSKLGNTTFCLDKNAGYGYVVEVEKMVDSENKIAQAEIEIDRILEQNNLSELPADRLERMYAHYNTNWQDYYETDKVFTIN